MDLLQDYTFQIVALGAISMGIMCGISGTLAVLRKQSLLGDSIAHSSLAGIAISFIMLQRKDTISLLLGALVVGLMATYIINFFVRQTRVNFDSSLAIVMTMFFGIGLMLLTYIQKTPNSNQAGLERFLFGQAATILKGDVFTNIILTIIMLVVVIIVWNPLKLFIFNEEYAYTVGFNTKILNFVISSFLVTSVIVGIQMVGVVLMSALLIMPSVASRQWSKNLKQMMILSCIFGAVSGLIGTFISSAVSKFPTGPAIVLVASILVFVSLFFSPSRGILRKEMQKKHVKNSMEADMVLIHFYTHHPYSKKDTFSKDEIYNASIQEHNLDKNIDRIIRSLVNRKLITKVNGMYKLTEKGKELIRGNVSKEVAYD